MAPLQIRQRKPDNHVHEVGERGVHVLAVVRGHNHGALVVLDPLQQAIGFWIGVSVVGVKHVCALAEESGGLVQREDDVGTWALSET